MAGAVIAGLFVDCANAATATASLNVRLVIQAGCTFSASSTLLDFGTYGALTQNIDQTASIVLTCTNTTPYNIGLSSGTGSASVTMRKMTVGAAGAGAAVGYALYSDSARTTNWGNDAAGGWQGGTGTGSAQTYTVYGRVPQQTSPAPGTYQDTVTVTVNF